MHNYTGREEFGSRSLSQLGLPLFDVFIARNAEREIAYIPHGDAPRVLGVLAEETAAT